MKKVLAVLLVLMMGVVFMVGCGGGDAEAPADNPAAQEEVQGEAADQVEQETAQDEMTDQIEQEPALEEVPETEEQSQ